MYQTNTNYTHASIVVKLSKDMIKFMLINCSVRSVSVTPARKHFTPCRITGSTFLSVLQYITSASNVPKCTVANLTRINMKEDVM
jgi:hypothetical protein